jgi:hypothetical protein
MCGIPVLRHIAIAEPNTGNLELPLHPEGLVLVALKLLAVQLVLEEELLTSTKGEPLLFAA